MTISKNPQPNISKREQIIEEIRAHMYLLWISPTKETILKMLWAMAFMIGIRSRLMKKQFLMDISWMIWSMDSGDWNKKMYSITSITSILWLMLLSFTLKFNRKLFKYSKELLKKYKILARISIFSKQSKLYVLVLRKWPKMDRNLK